MGVGMTPRHGTLSVAAFPAMQDDPRWLGFGYLGGRRNMLDDSDPEAPAAPDLVARIDRMVIDWANDSGWSYEQLFEWANSKLGRWFADAAFSGADLDQLVRMGLLNSGRPRRAATSRRNSADLTLCATKGCNRVIGRGGWIPISVGNVIGAQGARRCPTCCDAIAEALYEIQSVVSA